MRNLPEHVPVYLIGADYSGQKKGIRLIFYDGKSKSLYAWYDTNHEPYCYSNLSPFDLEKIEELMKHPSFKRFEIIQKYDALSDRDITVTKVIAKDPKAIGGGKPNENIRDIIPNACEEAKVWEAKIDYGSCYIFDNQLEMGMPYMLVDGKLIQVIIPNVDDNIGVLSKKIGTKDVRWLKLFEYPIPKFHRVALDIEVLGESKTRVPDAYKAEYPVISACLVGSDGKKEILLLLREGTEIGEESVDASLKFFDEEKDLIKFLFRVIVEYPFVITFNGDSFDLLYLYNRAINLGMTKEKIPLRPKRRQVKIDGSIHIDLYRFFFNKSMRNYAFQGKYKSTRLDDISRALLGKGKLHSDENIWLATEMGKWSYTELANYNYRDSEITLELTTYNNDLVMKLIIALMRISAMSMEDLIRFPISVWIRGMIFYEHRKRNYLIPNRDDIMEIPEKGKTSTKAIIKGKKYKGAIVIEPIAGTHFNIKIVDFASLYPSIMKTRNLGYGTVNCGHKNCKNNVIPQTTHYVCIENKAIEGEIIGLLKDLRVRHYKKLREKSDWYSVIEQSIKVIVNAAYGVFGNDSFNLYCPPVAEIITAVGRNSIKQTIKKARELDIEVLYGDTDSIFLKNPTDSQINSLIKWSNQTLDLDLEVDKEYRYVCLSSRKKNYLGVKPDGSVDIKGMTGKKKHVPIIIKDAFDIAMKYLAKAESPEEIEACKKALKKVIHGIYYRIKRRDFSLEEIAYNITLGKSPEAYEKTVPQHARAAKMLADELGIFLKKGDSVAYVKTIGKSNVKPLQLAKKKDVDIKKYHEQLQSTFEQLLDALDVDYDSIIGVVRIEQYF